jgi:hypothetical protein
MSLDDPNRNLERQVEAQARNRPRPSGYLALVIVAALVLLGLIIWAIYEPQQSAPAKQTSPPVDAPAKEGAKPGK